MSPFIDTARHADHRQRNLAHTLLMIGSIGVLTLVSSALLFGWGGALMSLLTIGVIAAVSPRIRPETVMRLYRAQPVDPRHGGQLLHIVEVLADRAELPAHPRLYVVPSMTLNAFATGQPDRAAIAITEGMLRTLSLREIAGVLAHEMSHIRNRDLVVMGLADIMTRLMQLFSYVAVGLAALNIPMILLGGETFSWAAIALLYLSPALSNLLQLALSRTREFDADLEAAGLTGDPQGLAAALAKVERAQGRLWQDLLLPPTRRVAYPSLLRSHPETEERIRRLADIARHPRARPIVLADAPMFTLVGLGPGEMTPRRHWPGLWY